LLTCRIIYENETGEDMDSKIYIKQWLELKPYSNHSKTDTYYLKLSNDVKNVLVKRGSSFLKKYINEAEIDLVSCFLVSYFEDIISGTNIWTTFVKNHKKLYNKELPFYDTSNYYEGEINIQDITFLIWYYLHIGYMDNFLSPFDKDIAKIASGVMDIFEKEYEYAPENETLKKCYELDVNKSDYYHVRYLIETILFRTYLFCPDTLFRWLEQLEEASAFIKDKTELYLTVGNGKDAYLNNTHTKLLSMKGKEWVAGILGGDHPWGEDIQNISSRVSGIFLYKGHDQSDVFLEHVATGRGFKLTKKSFDEYMDLEEERSIVFLGMVKWQGEWWFSGISSVQDYNEELIMEVKNNEGNKRMFDKLDYDEKEAKKILKGQYDAFLKYNGGAQIAFMESDKVEGFCEGFIQFYNDSLDKSKGQTMAKVSKEDVLPNFSADDLDYTEIAIVFFNSNSGLEIATDIENAFPLSNNPYCKYEGGDEDFLFMLMADDFSPGLVNFCIENCKNDIPFLNDDKTQEWLGDLDFLLRFWKNENYFPKPNITMVNSEEYTS